MSERHPPYHQHHPRRPSNSRHRSRHYRHHRHLHHHHLQSLAHRKPHRLQQQPTVQSRHLQVRGGRNLHFSPLHPNLPVLSVLSVLDFTVPHQQPPHRVAMSTTALPTVLPMAPPIRSPLCRKQRRHSYAISIHRQYQSRILSVSCLRCKNPLAQAVMATKVIDYRIRQTLAQSQPTRERKAVRPFDCRDWSACSTTPTMCNRSRMQ
jgi:hypothetical protein